MIPTSKLIGWKFYTLAGPVSFSRPKLLSKRRMSGDVFVGVHYYVVDSNLKSPSEVKQLLREGGASREFYYSELVTHIISDGPVSASVEGVSGDFNKHTVVHSDWVKMSLKCGAQLPLAPFQVSVEKLFSGLTFCPSKLSTSDSEKLCVLVLYYGGKIQRRLDSKVTHLVTVAAKGSKFNLAIKHPEVKIVTPHWVLDCIQYGQLHSTDKYHPSLLKTLPSPSQSFNGGVALESASSSVLSMPVSISNSLLVRRESLIGENKAEAPDSGRRKSEDKGRRQSCHSSEHGVKMEEQERSICDPGKEFEDHDKHEDIEDQDKSIESQDKSIEGQDKSIEGQDKVKEDQDKDNEDNNIGYLDKDIETKDIGDQGKSIEDQDKVTEDQDKDIQSSKDNNKGFEDQDEDIQNKHTEDHDKSAEDQDKSTEGQDKSVEDQDKIIQNKDMEDQENDRRKQQEENKDGNAKVCCGLVPEEKMEEDEVVSSEPEVGASGSDQLLEGIVICFIDYQECVEDNTLEKWKLVVAQHGGEVVDRYDPHHVTHLLALHKKSDIFSQALRDGKCIASAHWLNDVLTEQKMFPPKNPIHFPTAFKWQFPGAEEFSMTLTNYTDSERELVKDMLRICGITYTGHLTRNNTHLVCKRPEGKKYEMAREWGVQVVNSRFLAHVIHEGEPPPVLSSHYTSLDQSDEFQWNSAAKAALLLDTWAPFMKQYAERHHPTLLASSSYSLLPTTLSEESGPSRKRRRSSRLDQSLEGHEEAAGSFPTKLRRRVPIVLFTGIGLSTAKKLKQVVTKLGGLVTESGRECSHLVTPRITRTVKFLSAISACQYVVTPEWVEECSRRQTFIPVESFALQDAETEKLFGMRLADSLQRARQKRLLEGMCVCQTASVQPPFQSMREIVESAGGELIQLEEARARFLTEGGGEKEGQDNSDGRRLVVLSAPADIEAGLCEEFTAGNIEVYNAELILTGVLNQLLNFEVYTLVV